jgi:hypothetical protein
MDWFQKEPAVHQTNGVIKVDDEELDDVVGVAARGLQALVLRRDGTVVILGRDWPDASDPPAHLTGVARIAVEGNSRWLIRTNGRVAQWGSDQDPEGLVAGLTDVKTIAWVGYRSYLVLKHDGTLRGLRFDMPEAVMDPTTGQPINLIGIGNRPVTINGQVLGNVKALSYLNQSPVVLLDDGAVFTLERGEMTGVRFLGAAPFQYNFKQPVAIDGVPLRDVSMVAGSGAHVLAVKSNGTVIAWGENTYGQCAVPIGLSNVVAVAAAEHRSLALRKDGTVVGWGGNFHGEGLVPAGLSNVISIAAGSYGSLAVTTGTIPGSVFPNGRLEKLEREADLVFKGEVISTRPATNASFPPWGNPHATQFRVINVFKGDAATNGPVLWHNTSGPMGWGGGSPPSWHQFEPGQSYLIFAVNLDKPDYLYTPPADAKRRVGEFRQTFRDGVTRTVDNQLIDAPSIKAAHWQEFNRMLNDVISTNVLYAIGRLDELSKTCQEEDRWRRSGDFKRPDVLRVLQPLLLHTNEAIAIAAINCYHLGLACAAHLREYERTLLAIASHGQTIPRRVTAIAAFKDSRLEGVRTALPDWLADPDQEVRAQAVSLLADFPGKFSESALRRSAKDDSPRVRAVTADAIGKGQMTNLLGVLAELFQDPVGRDRPVGRLTLEDLEGGGRASVCCDVHTSAGYALLDFELSQVAEILKTNRNDPGFRLQFLCKLSEKDAAPWLDEMTAIMEARRERMLNKAVTNRAPPGAYMYLSGTYYRCWKVICEHLQGLPFAQFERGKSDRYLRMLEQAGNTGSQEPLQLYELYKMKGLNKRAARFRSKTEASFAWASISNFFDKIDAKYPPNGMIPDQ